MSETRPWDSWDLDSYAHPRGNPVTKVLYRGGPKDGGGFWFYGPRAMIPETESVSDGAHDPAILGRVETRHVYRLRNHGLRNHDDFTFFYEYAGTEVVARVKGEA